MRNSVCKAAFFGLFAFAFTGKAQQGKDGAGNITAANTIVNLYTPLTASVTAGSTSIQVGSSAGFSAGDLIYIIQVQGATVNAYTYQFGNPNQTIPNDTSSGKVKQYNNTGYNEFAEVTSVSGNIITLDCGLKHTYGDSLGGVPVTEVVRVPRYTTLTITSPGSITCQAWNGTTGGVVAIEVKGKTTIGAGGTIDVSGKGFRGGTTINAAGYGTTNVGSNYNTSPNAAPGGHKGESIVGDTNVYKRQTMGNYQISNAFWLSCPLPLGKGNVANGGGGGNSMNCGGGGGANGGVLSSWNGMGNPDMSQANYVTAWGLEPAAPVNGSFRPTSSSGGGRGGYAFSSNSSTGSASPIVTGPNNNAVWGSDSRHNDGGWGGTPVDSVGRIFMGGGGGAGDGNDKSGTNGANGGGIIYILSYDTVTGGGQILADGATALSTNSNTTFGVCGDDGAGGGGGGGTVVISAAGSITMTNATPISAKGGNGGNYQYHCTTTTHNFGPGGGGGGGRVEVSSAVTNNVSGGSNGIVVLGGGNNSQIAQKFPPNGATAGGAGTSTTTTTFYITAANYTICAGSSASLTVTANGTGIPNPVSYNWYNTQFGGSPIFTGNPYNTGPLTVGTYTYYAGTCPGTYRIPVIVTVTTAPTLTVSANPAAICSGQSATLTASGASSYTWSANAGSVLTATASVSPASNDTYTVTGANGTCISTGTVAVSVSAAPSLTVAATATAICSGQNVVLTASGATNYTWSANAGGGGATSVTVTPTSNTTYTLSGDNGGCSSSQTVAVNVTTTPTVTAASTPTIVCAGASITLTASGATNYTWSANAGSGQTGTVTITPAVSDTYTVTGANGLCVAQATAAVIVNNPPTKADSVANAAGCGQSNGSYVLNSVTGGTGPYQIDFNNTGFANISSFSYTVPNLSAGLYPIVIKDNVGCTYTTSVNIANIGGITKIDSSVHNAYCNPSNNGYIVITSVTGGTSPYQVNVNGGGFTAMTLADSIKNLSAGTYTVVVKDNAGCMHTSQITVASTPPVTQVSTASQNAICNPVNSGMIVISSVTGGSSPYQVSVSGVGTASVSTFPDSLKNLTAGNYTVSVTDMYGCKDSVIVNVGGSNGPASATLTAMSDTCNKSVGSITVTNVSGGAPSYMYSINGVTFQSSNTFTGLAAGHYTITVKDNNGCTYQQTDSVNTVGPTSSFTITSSGATTFCQGGNVVLSSSLPPGTAAWNTSATTATISVNSSGTYYQTETIGGCSVSSNTIIVTVNPTPTITVTQSATICNGSSTTLTATGAATYTWSPSIGLSSTTGSTVSANPTGSTVYTVTATDANNCSATAVTTTVSVLPAPASAPGVSDTLYYCLFQQNVPPLSATTSNGATLNWYDASGNSIPTPTPATNPLGVTTYYVSQNIGPCSSSKDSIKVIIVTKPSAVFVSNPTPGSIILAGQPVTFTPINTANPLVIYAWNFGANGQPGNASNQYNPTYGYANAGTYCPKLVVTSTQTGCKDSSTLCIDIISGIDVIAPNIFSPNGDGINEMFSVKAEGMSDLTCEIYDRWGLKISEWTGLNGGWDGTNSKNGKAVSDGTYYYIIQATDVLGKNHEYHGYLQLLK